MSETYDPKDVSAYYGKTFITRGGLCYNITEDGRFTGSQNIEGAKVELIAGVTAEYETCKLIMKNLNAKGNPESKQNLKDIINTEGKEPVKGLRLLVCITDEDTKKRNGLLTRKIIKIIENKEIKSMFL